MSDSWYYVLEGERQGPVEQAKLLSLVENRVLGSQDYVWKKGFENWTKIQDVNELNQQELSHKMTEDELPNVINASLDLNAIDKNEKCLFIKVGADRGADEVEYGPFNLNLMKKLFDENRINGKTFIFHSSINTWIPLAQVEGFEQIFNELPPILEEKDKRAFKRKPLIARMFIQNNNAVFEGICRDLSIGGMQVLVDNFPGSVGEKISINVHPDNSEHHFVASGIIVRALEGGHGFSFRFVDLDSQAINSINSYIG
ncbi:MAG: GYF domain-containing protein [Bacteriovoracaceae bacterium]|jgi:hypothetical protein|nr:GYF domain-containing protein [Bacteriovoracaceae bacterium]